MCVSSGSPLPEQMDFEPRSLQLNTPTYAQPATLWPSPRNVLRQRLTIFGSKYYQILIATHLRTPEGWKAELS